MFLTSTDPISDAIARGLGAAFSFIAISWIIGLGALIATVALITWVVKKVWYAGSNKEYKRQQKEYRKQQKQWEKYQKEGTNQRNNTKEIKEIPKEEIKKEKSFENNPDWKWDEKNQLWRYKTQWDKIQE